jgi:hypothetical protein
METTVFADANDWKPWTREDLADLRACISSDLTVEQTAAALSREGSIEDILRVAQERRWKFQHMNGFDQEI